MCLLEECHKRFSADLQVAVDQTESARPTSNGSSFQPKGAVFKVHSPKAKVDTTRDERPSSVKSETGLEQQQTILERSRQNGSHDGTMMTSQQQQEIVTMQRSQSVGNVNMTQNQPQQKGQQQNSSRPVQSQVKTIQNISITTTDSRNVVFSTNTQMAINKNQNGQGPYMSESAFAVSLGVTAKFGDLFHKNEAHDLPRM